MPAARPLLPRLLTVPMCACLGMVPLLGAASPPPSYEPTWTPPLLQHSVVEGFRPPSHDWESGHRGVDFAAQPGEAVRSIGAGVVTFVGTIAGKQVVAIDHSSSPGSAGLRSTYEPVTAFVHVGQQVDRGQVIGQVASSGGHCGGACLHLGVRQRSVPAGEPGPHYVDPLALLRPRAILKPM